MAAPQATVVVGVDGGSSSVHDMGFCFNLTLSLSVYVCFVNWWHFGDKRAKVCNLGLRAICYRDIVCSAAGWSVTGAAGEEDGVATYYRLVGMLEPSMGPG